MTILVTLLAASCTVAAPRVAVLEAPVLTTGHTPGHGFAEALGSAGFEVDPVTFGELCQPDFLSTERYGWLVHPCSRFFPVAAGGNVRSFLEAGGGLVLLGGQSFETSLWRVGDRWLDKEAMEARRAASADEKAALLSLSDEGASAWGRATSNAQTASELAVVESGDKPYLRFDLKDLTQGWDNFVRALPRTIPAGHNALCFSARSDGRTPQLLVELTEDDGARWVAVIELRRQWTAVTLATDDFGFWEDGSPGERGGAGDALRMEHVARLSFGLAYGLTDQPAGDHRIEIAGLATARVDTASNVDLSARFALPGAFSDYEVYDLRDVVRVTPYAGQDILDGETTFEGGFDGLSSIGFELPNESEFVPLLAALDAHGRTCGWALGLLVHYEGAFKGSQWILSGITSPEFYGDPEFAVTLARTMAAIEARDLVQGARDADRRSREHRIARAAEVPARYCRVSDDGKRLLCGEGRPLFMVGCNYIGPFDRRCYMGGDRFDANLLDSDFRKARGAGLNCLRFWLFGMQNDPDKVTAIRELARRYGIYLFLHLGPNSNEADGIADEVRKAAQAFADEPMVIGYDLMNEPYVGTVGGLTFGGEKSPLVRGRPYDTMATEADRKWVAKRMERREGWPPVHTWLPEEDARQLYAAYALWNRYAGRFGLGGMNYSTFPGLERGLPRPPEWEPFLKLVDDTFAEWIRIQVEAIREVDSHHLIAVGYNSALSCLPCNEQLDFVSHHVYQRPSNLENVMKNCTTLDRLSGAWPAQPITLGEFGYTNGLRLGRGYLDLHTSAVGEMIHYLYALANGHSGCMKWSLTDWLLPVIRRDAPWIEEGKQVYESRFGLYWYDGTTAGRPKPIAHALRFLRAYVDRGGAGGTLAVAEAQNDIGTGYRYDGDHALFIGDSRYESKRLFFEAGSPTNLMVLWDDAGIEVMSSSDAHVQLDAGAFVPGLRAKDAHVTGRHGALKRRRGRLEIDLLAGETVVVGNPWDPVAGVQ